MSDDPLVARTRCAPQPPIWACRGDDRAVVNHVAAYIRADRPGRLAIAGGETPRPILDMLAERDLPWHRTVFIPTDERLVATGHRASNYGMLSRALDQTPALVVPLGDDVARAPLDLVWLGMAEDGKIASLFSAADTEQGDTADLVHTRPGAATDHVPVDRLSLSLPTLAAARDIILVIRGYAKRRLVERAAAGSVDLPITRLLATARGPVRIFWSA